MIVGEKKTYGGDHDNLEALRISVHSGPGNSVGSLIIEISIESMCDQPKYLQMQPRCHHLWER